MNFTFFILSPNIRLGLCYQLSVIRYWVFKEKINKTPSTNNTGKKFIGLLLQVKAFNLIFPLFITPLKNLNKINKHIIKSFGF